MGVTPSLFSWYYYSGNFAGTILTFCFRYPETAELYGTALKKTVPREDGIVIPEKDVSGWMQRWTVPDPAFTEYVISCSYACDRLMEEKKIVFHGASFLWKDNAYVFSAPSGIGKTTQLRLWKEIFPDQVQILNGDKPILEVSNKEEVMVHPSPWKGKEGYGRDDIVAPLRGIILLKQAPFNRIRRIKPEEACKALFCRTYSTYNTEKEIHDAAKIVESILEKAPVFMLENKGDEESVWMTRHALLMKEVD